MAETERTNHSGNHSTGQITRLIVLMAVGLLLVIFAIQNSHEVIVNLWFWRFSISLALALIICIIIGFVLGLVYLFPLFRDKQKNNPDRETGSPANEKLKWP
jgi:uncharacterized integral membrane protein